MLIKGGASTDLQNEYGDTALMIASANRHADVVTALLETEKNIKKIFSSARGTNTLLFFDEADSLFGRG